jgi:hypothetical protein
LDFLRELFFVLRNVPALAHRYKKQSIFAAIFLCLSIGSIMAKNGLFANDSTVKTVLQYLSWVGEALTALVFLLAFIDLARNRLSFSDLVCTSLSVDAYYHIPSEEIYELVQRECCRNRTGLAVRNFAEVSDGYYENVPSWTVNHQFSSAAKVKLKALTQTSEARKNNFGSGDVYFYRQPMEFEPPLPSGANIEVVCKITAKGAAVDASAFTDGTVFYRGVDYDTLHYYMTIHAPVGYEVCLLDWGVFDSSGAKLSKETDNQEEPKVTFSGALLQWRVALARKHLRYMVKYRFDAFKYS